MSTKRTTTLEFLAKLTVETFLQNLFLRFTTLPKEIYSGKKNRFLTKSADFSGKHTKNGHDSQKYILQKTIFWGYKMAIVN